MNKNKAWLYGVTALAIAATVLVVGLSQPPTSRLAGGPCAEEDSNGCYWDASKQGNGIGRSFTVSEDGTVAYWDGQP